MPRVSRATESGFVVSNPITVAGHWIAAGVWCYSVPVQPEDFTLTWTGGGDANVGWSWVGLTGYFTTDTPGTYVITGTYGTETNSQSVTVVGVSNITTSATNAVAGQLLTFNANLTAELEGEDWQLQWRLNGELCGYGVRTIEWSPSPGEYTLSAHFGTSSKDVTFKVYAVTGLTASSVLVPAGESITFTATTTPANCPLPLRWTGVTSSNLTATTTFPAGHHTVSASLGTSTNSVSIVSVGVKEIMFESTVAGETSWRTWTDPFSTNSPPPAVNLNVGVGQSFRVAAMPDPPDATFPANWPEWSGAASGKGQIVTATFADVSTTESDFKTLTAKCGTSSNTVQAVVYRVDSINVVTNHVAIGTNTLSLTAVTTPASGGEWLVEWVCANATLSYAPNLSMVFPCDKSGSFTVTVNCGTSSASTNLNVYEVISVSASANPVAVGDTNLTLTAAVVPAGCPLPVQWYVGTNDSGTSTPGLPVSFSTGPVGSHDFIVTLGSSSAWTNLWTIGIKELKYRDPQTGGWDAVSGASHERVGTTLMFMALIDPPDAPGWPSGYPTWTGTGADVTGLWPMAWATFGTVSSTLSDAKIVKAKCGTSEKSASTIVFSMTLSNVPAEDDFARSHERFGLGEVVTVTNTVTPPGLTASAAGVVMRPLDQDQYNGLGGGGRYVSNRRTHLGARRAG